MAHAHFFPTIPFDGTVVYWGVERILCVFRPVFFSRNSSLRTPCQLANVHDVSWGTKGDNKVSTDLGVVYVSKNSGNNEVEVEEKDINAAYKAARRQLSTKPPKVKQKVDPTTKQQDFYKTFRTNVSHTDMDFQDRG